MYEIPGFRTGDLSIEAWCSFACTNMGQQTGTDMLFLGLHTHVGHLISYFIADIIA